MFGFSITIISTLLWPMLPPAPIYFSAVVVGLLMLQRYPLVSGSLLAVGWISIFVQLLLVVEPPNKAQNVIVRGEIISLVSSNGDWVSMDIRLLNSKNEIFLSKVLRAGWARPPKLAVGQRWELELKAKPITGVLNQGGYNQQRNLLSRHIVLKASVQSGTLLAEPLSVRSQLLAKLKPALTDRENGDLLLALLLGDKSLLSSRRWEDLRSSGTGHLIAISGLHLSVVSSWVFLVLQFTLTYCRPSQGRSGILIAGLGAAISAICYAYFAGFALPTQRALLMLLIMLLLMFLKRFSSPWERLLFALFIILLIDPLACMSAGFWLSFSALTIILLTVSQKNSQQDYRKAKAGVVHWLGLFWAIQWRLSIGLGLVQSLLFGGISFYGLMFNLIFVPWFSFVVIPLSFVSFVTWGLFGGELSNVFYLADLSLSPFSDSLALLENLPNAWLSLSSQEILAVALLLIGGWLILRLTRLTWRLVSLVFSLPFIITAVDHITPLEENEWRLHLLDVGQGLSAVIEKSGRAIIYDTGAAYGEHFSYAERVVAPFLKYRGINHVDYIIVSHGDNDHAGGISVLRQQFPKAQIITDVREYSQLDCRPKSIHWHGLDVDIIAPALPISGNNGSCVVKVSDKFHQILLPGDIEKATERLLTREESALKSEVLVAPHHGSRTSSTVGFIDKVSPKLVLFAAGFNNRYGFPKQNIIDRYTKQGARVLVTGEEGQISVLFHQQERQVRGYRTNLAPFWYNRLFRFGESVDPE